MLCRRDRFSLVLCIGDFYRSVSAGVLMKNILHGAIMRANGIVAGSGHGAWL